VSASSSPQKSALRQKIREALEKFTASERALGSDQICRTVLAQPVWKEARAVLLFAPTRFEPDIRPLLENALRSGKVVTLPRYSVERNIYLPCRVEESDGNLQPGPFGIAEPGPAGPIFPANQLDFSLVPGVGFALNGGRLGRGKGHYDRLLAEVHGFKCGVAFDCQVVAEIPCEPHDVPLNCILTPAGWHLVATTPVLK
jgi:5-formyltetrahydrofolate cyclo-ligase